MKTATPTVQRWGNSLAVRIPAATARAARIALGQRVELTIRDDGVLVTPTGRPGTTLAQKLAEFDPRVHGGEVMPVRPLGLEAR